MSKRIIGYGICGAGEAGRYLENTLKEFKRLCDDTIILLNNVTLKEKRLIKKYGFKTIEDNREWGKNQNKIKYDFIKNEVSKLNPDITICLDMDEVFTKNTTREVIENIPYEASKVYIINLWGDGYRDDWSFWNVRMWQWRKETMEKLGDHFFQFENRPLHCGLAPKWTYHLELHAPIILKHYGLKEKSDRMRKVERYKEYDPKQIHREPQYYKALETDHFSVFNEEKLQDLIIKEVESFKQPLNKKIRMINNKEKRYLVIREFDGFVFECSEGNIDDQLKRKFKGQGFKLLRNNPIGQEEKTNSNNEVNPLKCLECGFVAKSPFGFKSHQRKHNDSGNNNSKI